MAMRINQVATAVLLLGSFVGPSVAQELVEIELTISEQMRAPAGEAVLGLTINGTSPGPVLRFREGDRARITVHNSLAHEPTLLHWHGLLVPSAADGVPFLTTPPILPGGSHVYEFPLRQSGTYWYHSHVGLQEQRGVYGAIVIDSGDDVDVEVDRDHVVVLSDWTNEPTDEVMRTLVRGSDRFAFERGDIQSVLGAFEAQALGDFFERERSRMPPMHISDVAYDAFLANGERVHRLEAEPGERVRIRVINAGASTYFHLTWAAGPMTIVSADGNPVKPVDVRRLLFSMAETYDVLLTMPEGRQAVELRATAQDGSGYGSILLTPSDHDGTVLESSDPKLPNLYKMDEMVYAGLESVNTERAMQAATVDRPFAPYALLESTEPTTLVVTDADEAKVRKLTMRLTGDMRRYLWGFDGKLLSEEAVIRVSKGEVLRIEFINDTMMHHPLHLHGHFFRVLNGKGAGAPRKHTVDVPPMGRRTIEWIADEEAADWLFHCHLLYHMKAGMTRVFSYRDQGEDHTPSLGPMGTPTAYTFFDGAILSHETYGALTVRRAYDDYQLRFDSGILSQGGHGDRHLEFDVTWSRFFEPDLAARVGYRYTELEDPQGLTPPGDSDHISLPFVGVFYRLPYNFETALTIDSDGEIRGEIEKDLQITPQFSIFGEYEYDTLIEEEWHLGGEWALSGRFGLAIGIHSERGAGAGFSFEL